MVTTINSRKRLLSLSNKRKKGGNKKQRSKKKTLKRTRTKKKIRGGSKPNLKRKLNNLETQVTVSAPVSLMFGNLHGQYLNRTNKYEELIKEQQQGLHHYPLIHNIGAGLRDDFMYYIFANYANLSPACPLVETEIIERIEHARDGGEWHKILTGLKLLQNRYKIYYSESMGAACSLNDEEEGNIRVALKFLEYISIPNQELLERWGDGAGPGAGVPRHIQNKGFTGSNTNTFAQNSQTLQKSVFENDTPKAKRFKKNNSESTGLTSWWTYFIQACDRFLGTNPYDFEQLLTSTFHIASTLAAQTHRYGSNNLKSTVLEDRKQELYALTYGSEDGIYNNQSISIFTTYTTKIQALPSVGYGYDYFTLDPKDPILGSNCYITINKEQFLAISKELGLPNRYYLMKPKAGFDPDTYFFMDDINYILFVLFGLPQEEVISFYGSCRGSTI